MNRGEEQEIRSLTEAISISFCGKALSDLMNKTKGPGCCCFRKATVKSEINPAWDRLSQRAYEGAATVADPHSTTRQHFRDQIPAFVSHGKGERKKNLHMNERAFGKENSTITNVTCV